MQKCVTDNSQGTGGGSNSGQRQQDQKPTPKFVDDVETGQKDVKETPPPVAESDK